MRTQHTARMGLLLAALVTGCGASPSASAPPGSPEPLPTVTLTDKPPKEPTDTLPETGWVAGMVTSGGTGPCYGLVADDGKRYALYNTDGISLAQGARVRVKLETTLLKIYCGPGELMAMTAAEPIG
ncbi:hypothetical protein [Actinoplanes siamensis]|uniref:Uncharacterized protein n=1 Tax=Actinoplanes siamensis TaxID=1223317 RepID=A0A919N6J7_9ACTN|nr:hypothetical protein [Actinoplanes siamensis]GIF05285.1 hypothetical protein Asi03nite_28230 [Actinoplanes siamensis]